MFLRFHFAKLALLVAASVALSGCIKSSTYGTGKSQEVQLMEDLTSMFGSKQREPIQYVERPNIVNPSNASALPAPISADADDALWPESPNARLARLRADLESTDPAVRGAAKRELQKSDDAKRADTQTRIRQRRLAAGVDPNKTELTRAEQRALFIRAREQRRSGGETTRRRYLSEPPSEYRQPASTAVAGELGLTERQKQRCLQSKGRSGIIGSLRGRSTKKQCAEYLASLNLVDQRKTQ